MYYELTDRFLVPASPEQVWCFFSAADNLPRITPPWLAFTIVTPRPIVIRRDTRLDYTIRWLGLPVKWRTKIIEWDPPRLFVDLQVRGPYALWHHTHRFTPTPAGVECEDRVIYAPPLGPLGRVTHATLVSRQLLTIFRYRRQVIGQSLGGFTPLQPDVQISKV